MNRKYILITILLIVMTVPLSAQQIIQNGKSFYLANTLIIKVKNSSALQRLQKTQIDFSFNRITEIFPSKNDSYKNNNKVLDGIYLVNYNTNENPAKLAAKLSKMPGILWAEPKYIRRACFTPTDSLFINGEQDNLIQTGALQAWDITKGDKSVIIGIVDTGVDWRHPDLMANIYMKNDSLIQGSDLGGLQGIPDNDPSEDTNPEAKSHGTLIAGIACAVTNNEIGVASIGFNCSILPVKVSMDNYIDSNGIPYIVFGFEGIKWAADHGANVINCSWGGYGYSSYEQSIIDYALKKGAVVVAAKGNDSSTVSFYPADYDGVLSVGWVYTGDGVKTVHPLSNYGETIKVLAPGSRIYSTSKRLTPSSSGVYKAASGTSVAAPQVSGLAGLVWSKFPFYTPIQIAERIRVTSEFIDDYNLSSYDHLLGHGLINASRAVDDSYKSASVRADSICFIGSGNQENIFAPGEEISVRAFFTNYLTEVDNVTITFTTTDSFATIENNTFNTGLMGTLTSIFNESNEFIFRVAKNTPHNHIINFLLNYSNGTDYNDFQWVDLNITNTYHTHLNNNITTTITSKGTLGFNDYPNNNAGEGFKYKGSENLMFEGALMYGTGPTQVMNSARILDQQKGDFMYKAPMKTISDSTQQYGSTCFSDSGAGTNAMGLTINQVSRTLSQSPDNNYIFLMCDLENRTSQDINQLYLGYFIDWNISESAYAEDTTYFDTVNKVAITYNTKNTNTPYTAMALIFAHNNYGFYAINNNATSGPVQINDTDGFTDAEKWFTLSNGVKQLSAGAGDISYVISGGPYNIPVGQYLKVQFAIAAGSTLQEALTAIKSARIRYGDEPNPDILKPVVFQLYQNYPNPFNLSTTIRYDLPKLSRVQIRIFDILGRKIADILDKTKEKGSYEVIWNAKQFASGLYFYQLQTDDYIAIKKLLLIK